MLVDGSVLVVSDQRQATLQNFMVILHDAESVRGLISEWHDLKCASVIAARQPAKGKVAQTSICSGKLVRNIDFYSTQEPKGMTLTQHCVHAVPPSPCAL